MTRNEYRLECLKLANRPDRDIAQIVERAKGFEDYIFEPELSVSSSADKPVSPAHKKRGPGRVPQKSADNPDFLG